MNVIDVTRLGSVNGHRSVADAKELKAENERLRGLRQDMSDKDFSEIVELKHQLDAIREIVDETIAYKSETPLGKYVWCANKIRELL